MALAAVTVIAALGAAPAQAADITGAWTLPSGSVAAQTWTFTAGAGTLAGEGSGGPYTWPLQGTISGNDVQIQTTYRETSYTAWFVGTVSADGMRMSGTWADSGGFAAAATSTDTWEANRSGAPPPAGGGPPAPGAKAPSGVQVICNRGPDPDSLFTCTATVGGGTSPPTGTVRWSTTKGGFSSETCALVPTPSSPNVSSCTTVWNPGPGGFPAGVAPPVTATYDGDAATQGASGAPQLYGIASFDSALPPNLCAFLSSCDGIDVGLGGAAVFRSKTGKLATLDAGCYAAAQKAAKAAARIAQDQGYSCAVSSLAALSRLGDAEVEKLTEEALRLLKSSSKADQQRGQRLLRQADERFEQITTAIRKGGADLKAGLDPTFDAQMALARQLLASRSPADQRRGQEIVSQAVKRFQADAARLDEEARKAAQKVKGSAVRRRSPPVLASGAVRVKGGARGALTLVVPKRRRAVLDTLRRAGLRSVTLRLQVAATRSGAALGAVTRTTLKVRLR